MIAYLKGEILKTTPKGAIISTGNVGYFVNLSGNNLSNLANFSSMKTDQPKNLSPVTELYIYTHVREDQLELFGFPEYEELEFFKKLITINGIGPRLAMDILNVPMQELQNAILKEDLTFIGKIPGVGPKTSKRLILELKGTLANNETASAKINDDVSNALKQLGYSGRDIARGLEKLPSNVTNPEAVVSFFLKNN